MSLLEEVESCCICKYDTKVLDDTIKLRPSSICCNISRHAGCRKCEIIPEMHEKNGRKGNIEEEEKEEQRIHLFVGKEGKHFTR